MLSLDIPAESLDQARLEAVFEAANEDSSRHHRQGRPGDYQRKLARSTIIYLTNIFEQQLSFFGYGSIPFSNPSAARCVPSRAVGPGLQDDIATLKRVIVELQIKNGFRINEIASMRAEIELLKVGREGTATLNGVEGPSA